VKRVKTNKLKDYSGGEPATDEANSMASPRIPTTKPFTIALVALLLANSRPAAVVLVIHPGSESPSPPPSQVKVIFQNVPPQCFP